MDMYNVRVQYFPGTVLSISGWCEDETVMYRRAGLVSSSQACVDSTLAIYITLPMLVHIDELIMMMAITGSFDFVRGKSSGCHGLHMTRGSHCKLVN